MDAEDKEMLKFKTEVELRFTEMRKNQAQAALDETKNRYHPFAVIAIPIIIGLIGVIIALVKT